MGDRKPEVEMPAIKKAAVPIGAAVLFCQKYPQFIFAYNSKIFLIIYLDWII